MVETKIDHARLTSIMTGNTARNLPLHAHSSTGYIPFLHQNYWPMEDFNQIAVAKNCVAPMRRNVFFSRRFILCDF